MLKSVKVLLTLMDLNAVFKAHKRKFFLVIVLAVLFFKNQALLFSAKHPLLRCFRFLLNQWHSGLFSLRLKLKKT